MKLDAIRGFAALYVLCNHSLPKATIIAGRGWYFFRYAHEVVILFFILSGFVIQYSFATASDKSFKSYFLKRFLRIYIPLILIFIANYFMWALNAIRFIPLNWKTLPGNLLMLQNLSDLWQQPMLVTPFMNNVPLWTLSFEWWFYMLFFFVANQLGKKASGIVYTTGIFAAITYIVYPFFVNRELMYFVIWWAGTDAAKLYLEDANISIKNMAKPLLTLAIITLLLIGNVSFYRYKHPGQELLFATSPWVEVRHFGFALVALLIAIFWRKIKWFGFDYTLGLFQPLASISFALYISHWFMIAFASYLNNIISNIYLRTGAYFIVCCLFCFLVERIIYPYLNKKILHLFSVQKKTFAAVAK